MAEISSSTVSAQRLLLSRIVKNVNGRDNVGTVEEVVKLSGIVVRIECEGISGLEAGDGRNTPAANHFLQQGIAAMSKRNLPDRTDNEPVWRVEIGEPAIKPRIGRIGEG